MYNHLLNCLVEAKKAIEPYLQLYLCLELLSLFLLELFLDLDCSSVPFHSVN